MSAPILEVNDLHVRFANGVDALRGVSFALDRGEALAVIGESGAGKSTLAHSVLGLIQPPEASGGVVVAGNAMLGATDQRLRAVRWSVVSLVPQASAFNPVVPIGDQIAEPLIEHAGMSAAAARSRTNELAEEVLMDPSLLGRYPEQLSGGERREALLAMALALDPALVVLDEPTSGVDPIGRVALLERIATLSRSRGFALLIVSHDLPAAAQLGARCMVLYAGEAMESGDRHAVIHQPAHPYSRALVSAYPVMTTTRDLRPIRGSPPDPRAIPPGCPFHPRCTQAEDICRNQRPVLEPSRDRLVACHFGGVRVLLAASEISKSFRTAGRTVRALDAVSLTVEHGETVAIVGRSGSGKSTLARVISGHLHPDAGRLVLGDPVLGRPSASPGELRRQVQLVMQDPWDALSPRLTVAELAREPLDIAASKDAEQRRQAVAEMLNAVGLPTSGGFLSAHAHELSGGQLQRIVLARALLAEPTMLVADEPTSMLDPSEQARLLVVLRELQVEKGLALVLISHDISLVRKVSDRIVVLESGQLVEEGRAEQVSGSPRSEAARLLVDAAPMLEHPDGDPRPPSAPGGRWTR
jgi:peptide/nickel transport system ATP-binding protein